MEYYHRRISAWYICIWYTMLVFFIPHLQPTSLIIMFGSVFLLFGTQAHQILWPDQACPWNYQARTVGGFLVVVSLLAFCIRCIVGAFHNRASGQFRHKNVNESDVKQLRSQGGRWRSALGDAWEPERTDGDSIPDSRVSSEGSNFPCSIFAL